MSNSFRVIYLNSVKEKTKEGYRSFRARGLEEIFVQAAATIDSALSNDPRGFGDPCYYSPQLQMDIFIRAIYPFVVHYGVHRSEPFVFVNHLYVQDP